MTHDSPVSTSLRTGGSCAQRATSCLPERLSFIFQDLVAVQQCIQSTAAIGRLAAARAAAIALPCRNGTPRPGEMRPHQGIGLLAVCRAGPGAVVEAISRVAPVHQYGPQRGGCTAASALLPVVRIGCTGPRFSGRAWGEACSATRCLTSSEIRRPASRRPLPSLPSDWRFLARAFAIASRRFAWRPSPSSCGRYGSDVICGD